MRLYSCRYYYSKILGYNYSKRNEHNYIQYNYRIIKTLAFKFIPVPQLIYYK